MLYDNLLHVPYKMYKQWQIDLKNGPFPMTFSPRELSEAVPFRIDEVAKYYFNHSRDWEPHEFPNIVPRYPSMWFEFYQPATGRLGNKVYDYQELARQDIGEDVDISKSIRGIYVKSWDRLNQADTEIFDRPDILDDARWVFRAMIFLTLNETKIIPEYSGMSWQVGERGQVIFANKNEPYGFEMPRYLVRSCGVDAVRAHISGSILPVFMSLSLLQCQNVSTSKVPAKRHKELKIGTRQARRLSNKLKSGESFREHHVIIVNPLGHKKSSGSSNSESSSKEKAWHEMPGGFRIYGGIDPLTGKERGKLFGKWSGTYFFSAYERGNKEVGYISKEYEVKES